MFARPLASSARAIRPRVSPISRRFASTKPNGKPQFDEQAFAAAQRARKASGWISGAAVFGACAMGYALGALLYSRPPSLATQLLTSEVGIELQDKFQPRYGSADDYRAAIKEIKHLFKVRGKEDRVSEDEDDLSSHGISDWSYHGAELPTVVVWVDSTAEVQDIVRIANKYKVPITPFSGGTSLEGHFSSVSWECMAEPC
jgi:D-lactate dehydrogenase (cytochrome)